METLRLRAAQAPATSSAAPAVVARLEEPVAWARAPLRRWVAGASCGRAAGSQISRRGGTAGKACMKQIESDHVCNPQACKPLLRLSVSGPLHARHKGLTAKPGARSSCCHDRQRLSLRFGAVSKSA